MPADFDGMLVTVLGQSRDRGFLGPGPVVPHIERALDLLALIPDPCGRGLDLGSGGGLPGLPLALATPSMEWLLLDGSTTRVTFLAEAVSTLGLSDRVSTLAARAEEAGHDRSLRGRYDLVVARSFGRPAATAECAAPFLRVGGTLIVAEPPGGRPGRWQPEALDQLGMRPIRSVSEPSAFQLLEQYAPCPDAYPRRVGVPAKRPLF